MTLATHGRQAAAINLQRPPRVVDAETLPQNAARELAHLVQAAKITAAADENVPGSARDAMSYTITVPDAGQSTVLTESDDTRSPAFAALLTWLQQHVATQ